MTRALEIKLALRGDLKAYSEALERGLTRGAMYGARNAERDLKGRLRQDVVAAGLGQRTANTWRGKVYPTRGESMSPAVVAYSNAAHIKRAFEDGVTIRSKDGFWLAIPTDEVPEHWKRGSRGKGRITPAILEQRMGIRLRFVPIPKPGPKGRFALLVADKVRRKKGKRGGFAAASARALKTGDHEQVAMFVLVPQVTLKKRLHIAAIARLMEGLWPDFLQDGIDLGVDIETREFDA